MRQVGAYEAKTKLGSLLDEVERGESISITRHGVTIAQLVPARGSPARGQRDAVIEAIKAFRKDKRLGKLRIRTLIEEGRRF